MAVMKLQNNMVFWDMTIDESPNWNTIMQDVVSDFSITYEVNAPTKAVISIISESYIEDVFKINRKISISMGFDPLNLVPMFSGVIMKEPMGSASDVLSYSVEAINDEVKLGLFSKNKVHNPPKKNDIISTIATDNGYDSDVDIADTSSIEANALPIQKNKSDLEYLQECAKRWECVFWFTTPKRGNPILHF